MSFCLPDDHHRHHVNHHHQVPPRPRDAQRPPHRRLRGHRERTPRRGEVERGEDGRCLHRGPSHQHRHRPGARARPFRGARACAQRRRVGRRIGDGGPHGETRVRAPRRLLARVVLAWRPHMPDPHRPDDVMSLCTTPTDHVIALHRTNELRAKHGARFCGSFCGSPRNRQCLRGAVAAGNGRGG